LACALSAIAATGFSTHQVDAARTPASTPTAAVAALDEARAAAAAKNWQAAASLIDKALFPAPKEAAERYELLMFKGECRLQLGDSIGASSAFRSAARSASDLQPFAVATANALLFDRAIGGKFTPRDRSAAEPIDVRPVESRSGAMLLLRDEMRRQYNSQIDAALRAQQLPYIETVFKPVAEMYLLELCATGQADEAGALARQLGARALGLMRDEVRKSDARVDRLSQVSNSSGVDALGRESGRMGLTSQQRVELKRMIPYLVKIRDRATEYRRIAARIGGEPAKWDALVADTVGVIADVEALYNEP
jgi:hypothetical protein